ncbi:oxidoreductase [Hoyosella sp. YIM 151337]|uniref:oxidoreductase n=1 Tax=Hoyosella sp. YIM 151337 TaxID=2992742 RepID=UPI0022359A27|nr:oxidoreductase [Hoyosella sp. YIM 151337]MCW4352427.1 oxidoreductase [Hoyosella sp. YIM 151337]
MNTQSKAVLVTGCSTGIGHETARHLARAGFTVYATARKSDTLEDLKAEGCKTLALDVTDEDSMAAAVKSVEEAEGAIWGLVNNAGYSQSGAVETIPIESIRKQFETNVFGLVRMCQLVLPAMRARGEGRIVNIGSMGGKLTFPGGGTYHATKYAVEAFSDALRFEASGFGIKVVLIEPGFIKTHFADTARRSLDSVAETAPAFGAYANFNEAVATATGEAYEGPVSKLGGGPETVAAVIEKALTARRPRPRYTVTPSAKLLIMQRKFTPDRLWDLAMRTQFPRPGR